MIKNEAYAKKCKSLIQEPEIRFAGFLDMMGNLIEGQFKNGIIPLKNEHDRKKMFMEAVLRVRTRQDFDENLGPVTYAAARRKNIVEMTFLVNDSILFISAEPDVNIDDTAEKVLKICSLS